MSEFQKEIDTSGLNCPLPVLKARKALADMSPGQRLLLIASDKGANKDIPTFCKMTGNALIEMSEVDDKYHFVVEKA